MPEDRSLDDFASAGTDTEDPDVETGSDRDSTGGAPTEGDLADVEPAESTSTWTADGTACDRCGATVTRRWRDDADLVCPECAEW